VVIRRLVAALLVLGGLASVTGRVATAAPVTQRARLDVLQVSGLIDPVEVDFVVSSLKSAARHQAEAVVIQLNSPGAVVSVDRLVDAIRSSPVPVGVWVGQSGARANGGAGRVALAAQIVGATPGARIGGKRTTELDVPVIEAPTLGDFIVALDGHQVGGRMLHTAEVVQRSGSPRRQPSVVVAFAKPGLVARLLHTVASPAVAWLLLVVGLLLVVFEFFTAGVGVAGVVGAGCLVLSSYGLAVLPTRPLGLALVIAGIAGLAIDVQAGAPRFWTVAGTVMLAAGSLAFYGGGHHVGWVPVVLVVIGVALFMVAGMPAMVRARFSTPTIGRESMIGEMGTAAAAVDPDGTVRVRGALWRARTNRATPIQVGQPVRVVAIDGLLLEVEPEVGGAKDAGH
jgi:membrane-bound serine protease (ClpP class)